MYLSFSPHRFFYAYNSIFPLFFFKMTFFKMISSAQSKYQIFLFLFFKLSIWNVYWLTAHVVPKKLWYFLVTLFYNHVIFLGAVTMMLQIKYIEPIMFAILIKIPLIPKIHEISTIIIMLLLSLPVLNCRCSLSSVRSVCLWWCMRVLTLFAPTIILWFIHQNYRHFSGNWKSLVSSKVISISLRWQEKQSQVNRYQLQQQPSRNWLIPGQDWNLFSDYRLILFLSHGLR